LGGGREVGRSALLLQTPESNVLLDFGVGVSNAGQDSFPVMNLPEFDLNQLDAVIITHAHLDHIGFLPFLFKAGWKGPVYLTEPTRDLGALILLDYIKVAMRQLKQAPFSAKEVKEFLKPIKEALHDSDPDVRIASIWALADYGEGKVLGQAVEMLRDPVERVRV